MEPIDIKYALERIGVSQTGIATHLKVPRSTVYAVIYGISRSRQVEEHVATLIDRPLSEVWPKWYGDQRQPRKRRVSVAEALKRSQARLRELEAAA